jgi:Ser/Thr protein kinase RdoA (MazF antagonist)
MYLSSYIQEFMPSSVTPDLADTDRALPADTLRDLRRSIVNRRAPEQVLHGEPRPWNVLNTENGPLFMDFENTAHGAC